MAIPFEQIKEDLDRTWSKRLVDLIEDPEVDESLAADTVDSLSNLVDPRITARLFAIGTDVSRNVKVRKRALEVICDSGLSPEGEDLRAWWASGDELLQKEALEDALHDHAGYMREVLSDQLHPLYLYAVKGLEEDFDEPEWQTFVVQALSHFDAKVRATAARVAVWNEPKAAEAYLIDMARNDEPDCAYEAINTLKFYGSRAALCAVSDLPDHPDEECADAARYAVEKMTGEFAAAVESFEPGSVGRRYMTTWTEPVADLLALYSVETTAGSYTPPLPPPFVTSADLERVGSYENLDGPWQAKMQLLQDYDWSQLPDEAWSPLRNIFLNHLDVLVRRDATYAFVQRGDVDALLTLTDDRLSIVRQSAFFELQNVPANHLVVDTLHERLIEDDVAGGMVDELFAAWLHHVDGVPNDELINFALNDTRLSLRWHAINHLDSKYADSLLPLLESDPVNNWKLHQMVLDKFIDDDRRPPNFEPFADIDDLDMARSYANLLDI